MDLNAVRERINAIDDQIVDLFVERMKASADVASAKAEKNLPVLDLRREQAVLEKVMERGGEEFEIYINKLYQTIFDISKSYQAGLLTKETALSEEILKNIADPHMEFPRKAVVACQGVEGSYAARACDRLFALPSKMYFSNFESVFNAVESGLCRYGVLPIENSSAGSVTEVYDLMVRHKFYIVKSIKLHISHALLAKPGVKLEDVKEVVSHTQALQQCSNFLKANPNIKVTIFENTATAAKYVAESGRTDLAALSSTDCAKLYGLHVLQDGVQNNENNYTRFICITKNFRLSEDAKTISVTLEIPNIKGSLYRLLTKFFVNDMDLEKIESRPIADGSFDVRFFLDFAGNVGDDKVKSLLVELTDELYDFKFLGNFSEDP